MKIKTFFPVMILLIMSINGVCQNWQPFPRGQQSYFKHLSLNKNQDDGRTEVVRYQLDSLWAESEQHYTYFITGSFLKGKSQLTDYDSLLLKCYKHYSEHRDNNEIDRYIKRGDSLLFTGLGTIFPEEHSISDTVIFKPYCRESESWVSNGKTIRCLSTGVSTIFGITDSIKTFEIVFGTYTTSNIILSKNYGLIKFSPFEQTYDKLRPWAPPIIDKYELIGFSNNTITKGYHQPDFSDYFHLNAGDVLYWEETVTVPDFGLIYHKDSLVSVDKTPNSITYQYKRTKYDQNKNITEVTTASDEYLTTREGLVLENQPSWYGTQTWNSELSGSNHLLYLLGAYQLEIENGDTITNLECTFTPVYSYSDSSKIKYAEDVSPVIIGFSTREGITAKVTEVIDGGEYLILIGSKINGVKRGVTDFVYTGLNEFERGEIKLFPNPVADELTIKIPNATVKCVELYDLTGRLALISHESETIHLSHVNPGIYVVKIMDSKNRIRYQKIVKED